MQDLQLDFSEDDERITGREYSESAMQPIFSTGKAIRGKNEVSVSYVS